MNPRLTLFAATLVLTASATRAENSADAAPAYQLKNRSAFHAPAGKDRAPFWPIGWVKHKAQSQIAQDATVATPKVALDEKGFKVTSILLGSGTTPSLAVINGRAYSEGEFLRLPKTAAGVTTPPVRIRVQRISDGTVLLQAADQIVVASLQRPELGARRGEEQLLDADR